MKNSSAMKMVIYVCTGREPTMMSILYAMLMESHAPERVRKHDETQDQIYAEDLDEKVRKMVVARKAKGWVHPDQARAVMMAPWSIENEWRRQVPDLPGLGGYDQRGGSSPERDPSRDPVQVKQK